MTATDSDVTDPVVNLLALAQGGATGTAWAYGGTDLNANLLVFGAGEGVAGHVNTEVDVLLIGIRGEGIIMVDGGEHPVAAGQALVIPKGAHRAIRAVSDHFAYLTCHRRRADLWPGAIPQPDASPTIPGKGSSTAS